MVFDDGAKTAGISFDDHGIAVVQHNPNTLRVTSFFDLVGFSNVYDEARKRWLHHLVRKHMTKSSELRFVEEGVGYRPCTPDRLAIIRRVPRYGNLYIASGHCSLE